MEQIVESIKKVTSIVASISHASREQAAGIEQVNKAVTQMDEVTQQNAALVEEAAAAAESLGEQAQQLQQQVGRFKLDHAFAARQLAAPPKVKPERSPVARTGKAKLSAPAHDNAEWTAR
jgi:methyl-accepting chemotaxis protein